MILRRYFTEWGLYILKAFQLKNTLDIKTDIILSITTVIILITPELGDTMHGFYLAIGRQGSGKTAFITKLLVDNYSIDRKVYSNYSLFGIDYQKITFDNKKNKNAIDILNVISDNPNYFNNSIMLLDEIHIYFDSRDFMKQNNRIIQNFFSQLRKRNILLLATTQYILHLDIRIRRQALAVFQMTCLKDGIFRVDVHEIDGYYTSFIRTELVNLNDYFKYYDTNELIE